MKYTNFILTVIAILLLGIFLGTTKFISSAQAQNTTAPPGILNVKIVGVGRVSTFDQQPLPSRFIDGHTFFYLPVHGDK